MTVAHQRPHFDLVEEDDQPPVAPPRVDPTPATHVESQAATKMLMLALGKLSQRAMIALADLFCLLTVGSVFVLCMKFDDPSHMQLVMLGGYAVFVLAANWIVRQR